MDKLKMHTPDVTKENIARIAELFPECITEKKDDKGHISRAIDFDQLRQALSDHLVEGPRERYHLDWPGKREALFAANAAIAKTLRPDRDASLEFETTKHLFIQGDNLECLKLLQESYLNQIKLIYIDPPYNGGKDVFYVDDYSIPASQYLKKSNQVGDDSRRLVVNAESNGRFHSDWLSSLYSRLKLSRHLLSPDGVIFISIDDIEQPRLRQLCDEVFGEDNFVGSIVWKNATDNNPSNVTTEHEYVLVFAKDKTSLEPSWQTSVSDIKELLVKKGQELLKAFPDDDELRQQTYTEWFRDRKPELWPLDGYKYIDKGGVYAGIRGVHNPGREGYRYDVIHPITKKPCKEPLMGYRFPWDTMKRLLDEKRIIFGDDHDKLIELKSYAYEYTEKLSSVFELDGRSAAYDLRDLFPEFRTAFKNPKPVKLVQRFVSLLLKGDGDTVLDFYAGSGTTGEAVYRLNQRDGVKRNFILIQLDEPCHPDSEPAKAGIPSIAELARERVRRAAKKVNEAAGLKAATLDLGFRALKVDTSNMKEVYYQPDAIKQEVLHGLVDNVKEDRSDEDLLFQVLLDWGVDLRLPIKTEKLKGKTVHFVDIDALAACFEPGIDEAFIKELAKRKPLRAVFRDGGYGSDATKINVEQIFKLVSPGTEVKSI